MYIKKKFGFPLPFLRATNVENFLSHICVNNLLKIQPSSIALYVPCCSLLFHLKVFQHSLSLLLFLFHDYIVFLEGKFLEAKMSCQRDFLCFEFAGCYKTALQKLVAMSTSRKCTRAYLFLKTCDSLKQMILLSATTDMAA